MKNVKHMRELPDLVYFINIQRITLEECKVLKFEVSNDSMYPDYTVNITIDVKGKEKLLTMRSKDKKQWEDVSFGVSGLYTVLLDTAIDKLHRNVRSATNYSRYKKILDYYTDKNPEIFL